MKHKQSSSVAFEAVPTLESEIRQHQKDDEKLQEIRELLKQGKAPLAQRDKRIYCEPLHGMVRVSSGVISHAAQWT